MPIIQVENPYTKKIEKVEIAGNEPTEEEVSAIMRTFELEQTSKPSPKPLTSPKKASLPPPPDRQPNYVQNVDGDDQTPNSVSNTGQGGILRRMASAVSQGIEERVQKTPESFKAQYNLQETEKRLNTTAAELNGINTQIEMIRKTPNFPFKETAIAGLSKKLQEKQKHYQAILKQKDKWSNVVRSLAQKEESASGLTVNAAQISRDERSELQKRMYQIYQAKEAGDTTFEGRPIDDVIRSGEDRLKRLGVVLQQTQGGSDVRRTEYGKTENIESLAELLRQGKITPEQAQALSKERGINKAASPLGMTPDEFREMDSPFDISWLRETNRDAKGNLSAGADNVISAVEYGKGIAEFPIMITESLAENGVVDTAKMLATGIADTATFKRFRDHPNTVNLATSLLDVFLLGKGLKMSKDGIATSIRESKSGAKEARLNAVKRLIEQGVEPKKATVLIDEVIKVSDDLPVPNWVKVESEIPTGKRPESKQVVKETPSPAIPKPIEPKVKSPEKQVVESKQGQGISNETLNAKAIAEGKEPTQAPNRKSWQETLRQGRENYNFEDYHESLRSVNKAAEEGKPGIAFNEAEQAVFADHYRNIKENRNRVRDELNAAKAKGEDTTAMEVELQKWETNLEEARLAERNIGTTTGRALSVRNMIDESDYSAPELKAEWQHSAGGKLSDADKTLAEKLGKTIEGLNAKIGEAQRVIDEQKAQAFISESSKTKRYAKSTERKQVNQQKRLDATERLKKKWEESRGESAIYSDPLFISSAAKTAQRLANIAPEIIEIAKTYVDDGIVIAKDVASKVADHLEKLGIKAHPDEIMAVMAGKVKAIADNAEKVKTDWQKVKQDASQVFNEARKQIEENNRLSANARKEEYLKIQRAEKEYKRYVAQLERLHKIAERQRRRLDRDAYQKWWKESVENLDAKSRKEYKEFWEQSAPGQAERLLNDIDKINKRIAELDKGVVPETKKKFAFSEEQKIQDLIFEREARKHEADIKRESLRIQKQKAEQGWVANAGDAILDAIALPRALISAADISAPLTLGGFAALTNTRSWIGAFKPTLQVIRQVGYDKFIGQLKLHPGYNRAIAAGVDMPAIHRVPGEEMFMSAMADKLPYVSLANREYAAFLSKLRLDMFDEMVRQAESGGKKLDKAGLELIARTVNTFTGRGQGKIAKAIGGSQAGAVFFAPKYYMSLIETAQMRPLFEAINYGGKTKNWKPAQVIAKKYLRAWGAGIGLMYLADKSLGLLGYDVEYYPRSNNFGRAYKIQPDGTKISVDILPPQMRQMQSVFARLAFGTKRDDGVIQKGFYGRASVWGSLIEGKMAPVPKVAFAIIDGKQFGESYDVMTLEGWKNIAKSLGVPISVQNAEEIATSQKLTPVEKAMFLFMAPLGRGVNIQEKK